MSSPPEKGPGSVDAAYLARMQSHSMAVLIGKIAGCLRGSRCQRSASSTHDWCEAVPVRTFSSVAA